MVKVPVGRIKKKPFYNVVDGGGSGPLATHLQKTAFLIRNERKENLFQQNPFFNDSIKLFRR